MVSAFRQKLYTYLVKRSSNTLKLQVEKLLDEMLTGVYFILLILAEEIVFWKVVWDCIYEDPYEILVFRE